MLAKLKNSPIPIWVNVLLLVLTLLMGIQVVWFYFDHQALLDAGITIEGAPDQNIMYTTAGRLLAMVAATIFVVITQNPHQQLVVLLMSILREGQEMFIDPLFPYANAPASPAVDFTMHVVIIAAEIWAFITVLRIARHEEEAISGPASP